MPEAVDVPDPQPRVHPRGGAGLGSQTGAAARRGPAQATGRQRCWHVDETYVKVAGEWCYLYRTIDRDGTLVDVYLSETRDMAKAFLRSARSVTQVEPEQVTTDGHTSYPKAIAEELDTNVDHRTSQYKNNVIEQDHRGIKGRYLRGFKAFGSADRFCRAFDETSCARPAASTRAFRSPVGGSSTSSVSRRCRT
jgi:transposase-like protein